MSQQGPIVIVSNGEGLSLVKAIADAKLFPLVGTNWQDAAQAIARVQPAAVIAASAPDEHAALDELARQIDGFSPHVVLIVLDPVMPLPPNAIPFTQTSADPERLTARLNAALRVRTLHATVLRRRDMTKPLPARPTGDPLQDATVLLIGRGASYPALSVALGERMGVLGALSIEAAARHLNVRDIDGVIIGEGFSSRVIDAFLLVLSEDSRFRNLPVILTGETQITRAYDLPNLEVASGTPLEITVNAVPLIRQNAFEARLHRELKSIDAGGLLDSRTGLLTQDAFARDFARTIEDSLKRGAGLAVARFVFDVRHERIRFDAARLVSRLMRRMDFATLRDDGSVLIAFTETDLRNARMIARRLASVLKSTAMTNDKADRIDPETAVAALMPRDSVETILSRLDHAEQRAAS